MHEVGRHGQADHPFFRREERVGLEPHRNGAEVQRRNGIGLAQRGPDGHQDRRKPLEERFGRLAQHRNPLQVRF